MSSLIKRKRKKVCNIIEKEFFPYFYKEFNFINFCNFEIKVNFE